MALRFLIQFNCVSEPASLNLLLVEQNQVAGAAKNDSSAHYIEEDNSVT